MSSPDASPRSLPKDGLAAQLFQSLPRLERADSPAITPFLR